MVAWCRVFKVVDRFEGVSKPRLAQVLLRPNQAKPRCFRLLPPQRKRPAANFHDHVLVAEVPCDLRIRGFDGRLIRPDLLRRASWHGRHHDGHVDLPGHCRGLGSGRLGRHPPPSAPGASPSSRHRSAGRSRLAARHNRSPPARGAARQLGRKRLASLDQARHRLHETGIIPASHTGCGCPACLCGSALAAVMTFSTLVELVASLPVPLEQALIRIICETRLKGRKTQVFQRRQPFQCWNLAILSSEMFATAVMQRFFHGFYRAASERARA